MVQATSPASSRRRRSLSARVALGLAALIVGLGLAELAARLLVPASRYISPEILAKNLQWADGQQLYELDRELGFVPRLGNSQYDRYGIARDSRKVPDTAIGPRPGRRILFLGDSVTRRKSIIDPLEDFAPSSGVELLNAGVESWNPEQEVGFYLRHQSQLAADHVVLWLHNNDLTATALCLKDVASGDYVLATPGSHVAFSPTLYDWSMLYRMFVHSRFVHGASPGNYLARQNEVAAALARLRDEVRGRNAELTIMVLPILARAAEQTEHERAARQAQLAMIGRLGVGFVDLQPVADELAAAGIGLRVVPEDPWHPSIECGEVLAAAAAQRLFDMPAVEVVAAPRVLRSPQRVVVECAERPRAEYEVQSTPHLGAAAAWATTSHGSLDGDGRREFTIAQQAAGMTEQAVLWSRVVVRDGGKEELASWPWPRIVPRQ